MVACRSTPALAVADLGIGAPGPQRVEDQVLGQLGAGDLDDELGLLDEELTDGVPPMVDEWMVRGVVRSVVGGTLGLFLGDPDAPELWHFTDAELDELVPPLTRMINRRPVLRAAIIRGDEAAVSIVMARFLGRNFADRRRVRRAREELTGQGPGGPGQPQGAAPADPRYGQPGGGVDGRVRDPAGGGVA